MYQLIWDNQTCDQHLPLTKLCALLSVSKREYYIWQHDRIIKAGFTDHTEIQLKDRIHRLALEFPGYGYRRITKQLQREGFNVNHKKILKLLKKENLLCHIRKPNHSRKFIPITTNSAHSFPVYPNLAKNLLLTAINQLWVADITYIRLKEEFVYLAFIIDVFSRKCIGWEIDYYIDTKLTLQALYKAFKVRTNQKLSGLIHHSDRGGQYAATEYTDCLKMYNLSISMSLPANPYDNAFAETFIKTLKYEEVYLNEYESFSELYTNVYKFIEDVYNKKRLHSSIGYLPPNEFEINHP